MKSVAGCLWNGSSVCPLYPEIAFHHAREFLGILKIQHKAALTTQPARANRSKKRSENKSIPLQTALYLTCLTHLPPGYQKVSSELPSSRQVYLPSISIIVTDSVDVGATHIDSLVSIGRIKFLLIELQNPALLQCSVLDYLRAEALNLVLATTALCVPQ